MEEAYMLYAPGRAGRQESFALRCIYEIAMACAWNFFEEEAPENLSKGGMPVGREGGNVCLSHGGNMPE